MPNTHRVLSLAVRRGLERAGDGPGETGRYTSPRTSSLMIERLCRLRRPCSQPCAAAGVQADRKTMSESRSAWSIVRRDAATVADET